MDLRTKQEAQKILDNVEKVRNTWGDGIDYADIAPYLEEIEQAANVINHRTEILVVVE